MNEGRTWLQFIMHGGLRHPRKMPARQIGYVLMKPMNPPHVAKRADLPFVITDVQAATFLHEIAEDESPAGRYSNSESPEDESPPIASPCGRSWR